MSVAELGKDFAASVGGLAAEAKDEVGPLSCHYSPERAMPRYTRFNELPQGPCGVVYPTLLNTSGD